MSLVRFGLVGPLLALLALGPVALGARALRRRLLPAWSGIEAGVASVVLGVSLVVVVSEVLGSVGAFKALPLVITLAVVGAGVTALAGRGSPAPEATAPAARPPSRSGAAPGDRWGWAALVPVTLVLGAWCARTARDIAGGMSTIDTRWYHLPAMARFVQSGRVSSIQYFDDDIATAFYPATSSILHGVAFHLFGTDLLSTVLNLGWLLLGLASAWCIGRAFDAGPAAVAAAAVVFGTSGLVATQAGGAYTDVPSLALLLAAIAVVVQTPLSERTAGQDLIAAMALGVAVGMKYTMVISAGALCLLLVVTAARGERLRRLVVVLAGVVTTGGYFYARNLIVLGNPLPTLAVRLGPLSLPSVETHSPSSTVAEFLFERRAWSDYFISGFRDSYGPAWVLIGLVAAVGTVAALARRDGRLRLLGVVAVVSALGFVATPQYLSLGTDRPIFFTANLRYGSAALMLAVLLFAVAAGRWAHVALAVCVAITVITSLDPVVWPTGFGWRSFFDRVTGPEGVAGAVAAAAIVGLALLAVALARRAALPRLVLTVPALALALVTMVAVHGRYLDHRYVTDTVQSRTYRWTRSVHDARIGMYGGHLALQYPFAGTDLSNHEQYVGVVSDDGDFHPAPTCRAWVELLEEGRYDYVAIGASPLIPQDYRGWTRRQPDAEQVFSWRESENVTISIFRLDRDVRDRRC